MDNDRDGKSHQACRGERAQRGQFVDEMLSGVGRTERRRGGAVHVPGLLSTKERKSAARIASELSDGEVQAIDPAAGQIPRDWAPVC